MKGKFTVSEMMKFLVADVILLLILSTIILYNIFVDTYMLLYKIYKFMQKTYEKNN